MKQHTFDGLNYSRAFEVFLRRLRLVRGHQEILLLGLPHQLGHNLWSRSPHQNKVQERKVDFN